MTGNRDLDELEALAEYYDAHDTSDEMDSGTWVKPTKANGHVFKRHVSTPE